MTAPAENGKPRVATPLVLSDFHAERPAARASDLSVLRRLAPYARGQLTLILLSVLLLPAASFAGLVQPLLLKEAVDATVLRSDAGALTTVTLLYAGAIVIEFAARYGQTYAMQLAGQRAMARIRLDLFSRVQRLAVGYFDRTPVGRVVTRITNDVDNLNEFFATAVVMAVGDLVSLVGVVACMLYLDWELALVTFAALPAIAALVALLRRSGRRAFQDIVVRIGQLNAYLGEQVGGLGVVQAYRREQSCAREYREINASHREATHRAVRFESVLTSAVQSIAVACVVLVLYYASVKVGLMGGGATGAAYVGTVVAFYEYIGRFFRPIGSLAASFSVVQKAVASGERIFDLLEVTETDAAPATPSGRQEPPEPDAEPALSFRDVTFGYRAAEPVLHQVSFDVRRGERVAVVGATGAGKTTLTSLLLRLHDVQQGTVLVDGRDVRSLERALLRRRFAAVPQDVFLFAGSVLRNVALGEGRPDRARAEEALRRAGAWSLVAARGGLDAEVVERGQNFSAGERQLIAFARALYRDAPVLLLDEATASVDSETEAKLERAVEELLSGRTALVIAHRLSTVRRADRILVFHRGRIAEQGTHVELLAAGGRYAKLCRLSSAEE